MDDIIERHLTKETSGKIETKGCTSLYNQDRSNQDRSLGAEQHKLDDTTFET